MKKLFNLAYFVLMGLAAITFGACTDSYEYDPATVSGNQVFFDFNLPTTRNITTSASSFDVQIKRYVTEVYVDTFELLGRPRSAEEQPQPQLHLRRQSQLNLLLPFSQQLLLNLLNLQRQLRLTVQLLLLFLLLRHLKQLRHLLKQLSLRDPLQQHLKQKHLLLRLKHLHKDLAHLTPSLLRHLSSLQKHLLQRTLLTVLIKTRASSLSQQLRSLRSVLKIPSPQRILVLQVLSLSS